MKKYWYNSQPSRLRCPPQFTALLLLSSSGYAAMVRKRLKTSTQSFLPENMTARKQAKLKINVRRIRPSTVLLLWFQNILLIKTIPQKAFPWKLPIPTA